MNAPFFGHSQRDFSDVQIAHVTNKHVPLTNHTRIPPHVPKVRGYCQLDKPITLTELVQHLLCYPKMLKNNTVQSFEGLVKATVEYLEDEGFLRFLPDTNGELTFCNYKYFEEIHG